MFRGRDGEERYIYDFLFVCFVLFCLLCLLVCWLSEPIQTLRINSIIMTEHEVEELNVLCHQ